MPRRRKAEKGAISRFFRGLLDEHPEWLDAPGSNKELMARWDAANPRQSSEERKRIMQNLANLKSHIRKQLRERGAAGEKELAPIAAGTNEEADTVNADLELLEEHIDDCLSLARRLDPTGLGDVIKNLRLARNGVVWKLGE